MCATHHAHFILPDLITPIEYDEQHIMESSLWNFLQPSDTLSLLGQNFFLSTQFWNTLKSCASLKMTNQVSHLYNTTNYITVFHMLIFTFLSRQEENGFWTAW